MSKSLSKKQALGKAISKGIVKAKMKLPTGGLSKQYQKLKKKLK